MIERSDELCAYDDVTWYVWMEEVEVEAENGYKYKQLQYPRSGREYEYPIDFAFETPAKAEEYLRECHEPEETKDWVLCRRTQERVER